MLHLPPEGEPGTMVVAVAPVAVPVVEMAEHASAPASATSSCHTNCTPAKERYTKLFEVGSGAYGTVFKAVDRETGRTVALKQLQLEGELWDGIPAHILREVSLLRDFSHANIVQLLAIHVAGLDEFYLVFEYVDANLHTVLKSYRTQGILMPMDLVLKYSKELLSGIHACHVRLIVHRDLKPQNVLISPAGLKICDFGLARTFSLDTRSYTLEVVSLWYRAPELLLGSDVYASEVDMWSAGCIVAEMATGYATFPGDSEIGTLFRILKLLGTPNDDLWPELMNLEHWTSSFPKWPATGLRPILEERPELGEAGIDLLRGLLCLDPKARLPPRRARNHAFFAALAPGP